MKFELRLNTFSIFLIEMDFGHEVGFGDFGYGYENLWIKYVVIG